MILGDIHTGQLAIETFIDLTLTPVFSIPDLHTLIIAATHDIPPMVPLELQVGNKLIVRRNRVQILSSAQVPHFNCIVIAPSGQMVAIRRKRARNQLFHMSQNR